MTAVLFDIKRVLEHLVSISQGTPGGGGLVKRPKTNQLPGPGPVPEPPPAQPKVPSRPEKAAEQSKVRSFVLFSSTSTDPVCFMFTLQKRKLISPGKAASPAGKKPKGPGPVPEPPPAPPKVSSGKNVRSGLQKGTTKQKKVATKKQVKVR
jgi:hypothetical protein